MSVAPAMGEYSPPDNEVGMLIIGTAWIGVFWLGIYVEFSNIVNDSDIVCQPLGDVQL